MMRPRVFITRLIPEEGLQRVREYAETEVWPEELPPSRQVLLKKVAQVDGLLSLLTDRIDDELMAAAPRLRVVSNYAVGCDNIDVEAATARGILVCSTPGVLTETTADLAWALLLAGARRIAAGDAYVRAGRWKTWGPRLFLGQDVHGATLGIVGFGRIGVEVARRAQGFGMRVLYHDPHRPEALEREMGVVFAELDDLLRQSDFISLHTPLTPETRHLISTRELELMKPTAVLVNTSRGAVVDQEALREALVSGRIFHVALDVTDPEPIPAGDPLLASDNATVVPHIGSASFATRARMAVLAADNLIAALHGDRPPHPVNPEILERRT